MDEKHNTYTLITGASAGIGRAMAFECAGRGDNLLLIALDDGALPGVADEIRAQYGIAVHYLEIDLCRQDSPARVFQWVKKEGYRVRILINNAGFGRGGLFENISIEEYYSMMQLNNQAMVGLCYYFLPELKEHPRAHILNMSSMEATLPLPYKAVYTGTKNFVYAFSLALREELRRSNVRVTVLCPGPVLTNPSGLDRIKAHGRRARLLLAMPDEVARIAIRKMLKGSQVIIPGSTPLLIVRAMNLLPLSVKMRVLERVFRVYK
ncbi:MAG: SDR family NAD(P)-dependent oxidoreductase [Phaeodactylibacter sp.]|nr:SDR family NAD(P)-dependent oxidoreductase [Phaeodactylibacter sp.]MCB9267034.1 SDR family NAD(P)-dependent oxidoreductase [Lewinellaceae bacterium]MCB9289319.1 SDR family NAD(P)-dependent oxidoreductase [Lewinellaceae bacterium]